MHSRFIYEWYNCAVTCNDNLHTFLQMVENYKDFAFSDYGRVGRALSLYEVGNREEAIAEMEDVSISLKGYPGIFPGFCIPLAVWE